VPSRYKNRRHKLSLWSLPFDNVVFLDTDVFIVDGSINDLVTLHSRIPDMVLMSLDHSNGQNLNSGIMVFSPNVLDHEMMERCYTQPTLVPEYSDQEIITACFARVNRVLALGPLWGLMIRVGKTGTPISKNQCDAHMQSQILLKKNFRPYAIHFGWPKPWWTLSNDTSRVVGDFWKHLCYMNRLYD